jgi:hypothetical protein
LSVDRVRDPEGKISASGTDRIRAGGKRETLRIRGLQECYETPAFGPHLRLVIGARSHSSTVPKFELCSRSEGGRVQFPVRVGVSTEDPFRRIRKPAAISPAESVKELCGGLERLVDDEIFGPHGEWVGE